ncbi:hypothetical protein NDU88_001727 [Pleurodeles waltl]|uniref:Uncharacterized protein n=1 Tax=Pleurodeles waltl TaxID=8319 RepID=A0AAV7LZE2_PLEWA|nr:hypothetical protein NDU88_001727 [Pleurodeles waltl]
MDRTALIALVKYRERDPSAVVRPGCMEHRREAWEHGAWARGQWDRVLGCSPARDTYAVPGVALRADRPHTCITRRE